MTTPAFHPMANRRHGMPPRHQRSERSRQAVALTDDQYVATSLALVADLSQRIRHEGVPRHG